MLSSCEVFFLYGIALHGQCKPYPSLVWVTGISAKDWACLSPAKSKQYQVVTMSTPRDPLKCSHPFVMLRLTPTDMTKYYSSRHLNRKCSELMKAQQNPSEDTLKPTHIY